MIRCSLARGQGPVGPTLPGEMPAHSPPATHRKGSPCKGRAATAPLCCLPD